MHLPALFPQNEMSSLWQMLKGWVQKASPKVKAKWQEIQKMAMSSTGDKTEKKMAILNLALVRKQDWEERVVEMTSEIGMSAERSTTGTWLYRGELEQQVGKATTRKWIANGKLEKGFDSDDESMYRKVQKSDAERRTVAASVKQRRSGTGDLDDFEELSKSMMEHFAHDGCGAVATKKSKTGKAAIANGEVGTSSTDDAARQCSEQLKAETPQQPLALGDLNLPDDTDSQVAKAKATIKKAKAKLDDKRLEIDALIQAIGKNPDNIAAAVVQQLRELRVQMTVQGKSLGKMSLMQNSKVRLSDFKDSAVSASDMVTKLKKLKVCAKPHLENKDVVGSDE